MEDYRAFLGEKAIRFEGEGIEPGERNQALFDFQDAIVRWALRKGRAAIFADCGLGKTAMQLEWARQVPGRVLIFAPLCVGEQTIEEGRDKFGVDVHAFGAGAQIEILNYEMLHRVNPDDWSAVVLDESSILKDVDGKTRTRLIEMFAGTPYRLCCTATPAPNDPTEIGNHAAFLGVMTRAEMLASFFINRGEGNRSWDLKGHAIENFYRWLASWACFIRRPSDLGYDDEGFTLPPLEIRGEIVPTDGKAAPGMLFADRLRGVGDRAAVRKETLEARVARASNVVRQANGQVIIWCGLNAEQDAMTDLFKGECVSVSGGAPIEEKKRLVRAFLAGEARVLVTKPSIVGQGMNFQNAPTQVFVGLGDSYESYYQAIRRSWRYGQNRACNVHIVLSDMEEEILANVRRKEREAARMQEAMVGRILEFERAEIMGREVVAPYSEHVQEGESWRIWRGDCVERMAARPPASVDFSIFSPPFAQLFTYSASDRDLGNTRDLRQFMRHFRFVVHGLLRIMKPGRIVACHCQQLATTKVGHGTIGIRDFRGLLIRAFERAGFIHHGEICIDKNPQAQAIRTKSKSLLFAQLRKDSSWMRPALADYVLLMRAPGENAVPIQPDCTNEEWIEWAHPIWYHIQESDTLQVAEAREAEDEKHICALQLPTIRRCIRLYSNPGETVYSPFTGIGSEGYEAIKAERRFEGDELKESYFKVAVKNLRAAELTQGRMFRLPFDEAMAGAK
jgi:DNA modification methylase/superfamily II DNA or RNA helicase